MERDHGGSRPTFRLSPHLCMRTRLTHFWRRAGWNEFVFGLAAVVFCVSVWGFFELADDAPEGDYRHIEDRILLSFRVEGDPTQPVGPWWLPEVGRDVTALGSAVVLTIVTALVIGFMLLRRRFRSAVLVLLATAGGYAINSALKEHFERGRPDVVAHLVEETSMSFPSGHSMVGAATYLTLGVLLGQTVARRREKIYFVATALLLSFVVGLSRVYLGVHYPTDVLAGWAAGMAWAILCWGVTTWLQWRGTIRTPPESDDTASVQSGEAT